MKNKKFTVTQGQLTLDVVGSSVGVVGVGGETHASSGTYASELAGCVYTITCTKAGAMGGTAEVSISGVGVGSVDHGFLLEDFQPATGVAFDVGTIGVQLTLTEGGAGGMAADDQWTITCTGASHVIECEMTINSENYFPKQIGFLNGTGATIGITWIANTDEWDEYLADQTNFDQIEIPNDDTLEQWYNDAPKPRAWRILISKITGSLSADATVQCINYHRS